MYEEYTIIEESIDRLVKQGIIHIKETGRRVKTRSGDALQSNNVTYVLTNCRNRVHTLRPDKSIKYFARELLAYFYGSLNVGGEFGLAHASKYWNKICDENNCINSNYGYYVFHQLTSEKKTQLEWVREQFIDNIDTRKAVININNIQHKKETKDFPCTIGILYRIENGMLNCDVQSRSTDVVTGLPYDMGFFSVVTELLAKLVSSDLRKDIKPGYVAMHSNFTQIYDKTAQVAERMMDCAEIRELQKMPAIENSQEVLEDIYNLGKKEIKTEFMKWSIENGK